MTPMDSSPPGSSIHGILQAGILEWAAIPFSRGSSQPRDQTRVSLLAGRFFTSWATREACGRDQMGQKLGSESHQLSEPHFLICTMQLKNAKWYVVMCLKFIFLVFFPIIFRNFIEMSNCQNLIIEHFHHPVLICNHSHSPPSSVGQHPSTFCL